MTACQTLLGPEQKASGQAALALLAVALYPPVAQPSLETALTHLLNALTQPSSG